MMFVKYLIRISLNKLNVKIYSGFDSGLDKPQNKESNFNSLEQILDEDFITGQIQNDYKDNSNNGI